LIPEIEKEVNEGKNFAPLRQIYNSVILASWYKDTLKESLLGKIYVDKNKTLGVDVADKEIKNKIYNQYLDAFKKGVYEYIKEDYDSATKTIIPRKYFSGGTSLKVHPKRTSDRMMASRAKEPKGKIFNVNSLTADVGPNADLKGAAEVVQAAANSAAAAADSSILGKREEGTIEYEGATVSLADFSSAIGALRIDNKEKSIVGNMRGESYPTYDEYYNMSFPKLLALLKLKNEKSRASFIALIDRLFTNITNKIKQLKTEGISDVSFTVEDKGIKISFRRVSRIDFYPRFLLAIIDAQVRDMESKLSSARAAAAADSSLLSRISDTAGPRSKESDKAFAELDALIKGNRSTGKAGNESLYQRIKVLMVGQLTLRPLIDRSDLDAAGEAFKGTILDPDNDYSVWKKFPDNKLRLISDDNRIPGALFFAPEAEASNMARILGAARFRERTKYSRIKQRNIIIEALKDEGDHKDRRPKILQAVIFTENYMFVVKSNMAQMEEEPSLVNVATEITAFYPKTKSLLGKKVIPGLVEHNLGFQADAEADDHGKIAQAMEDDNAGSLREHMDLISETLRQPVVLPSDGALFSTPDKGEIVSLLTEVRSYPEHTAGLYADIMMAIYDKFPGQVDSANVEGWQYFISHTIYFRLSTPQLAETLFNAHELLRLRSSASAETDPVYKSASQVISDLIEPALIKPAVEKMEKLYGILNAEPAAALLIYYAIVNSNRPQFHIGHINTTLGYNAQQNENQAVRLLYGVANFPEVWEEILGYQGGELQKAYEGLKASGMEAVLGQIAQKIRVAGDNLEAEYISTIQGLIDPALLSKEEKMFYGIKLINSAFTMRSLLGDQSSLFDLGSEEDLPHDLDSFFRSLAGIRFTINDVSLFEPVLRRANRIIRGEDFNISRWQEATFSEREEMLRIYGVKEKLSGLIEFSAREKVYFFTPEDLALLLGWALTGNNPSSVEAAQDLFLFLDRKDFSRGKTSDQALFAEESKLRHFVHEISSAYMRETRGVFTSFTKAEGLIQLFQGLEGKEVRLSVELLQKLLLLIGNLSSYGEVSKYLDVSNLTVKNLIGLKLGEGTLTYSHLYLTAGNLAWMVSSLFRAGMNYPERAVVGDQFLLELDREYDRLNPGKRPDSAMLSLEEHYSAEESAKILAWVANPRRTEDPEYNTFLRSLNAGIQDLTSRVEKALAGKAGPEHMQGLLREMNKIDAAKQALGLPLAFSNLREDFSERQPDPAMLVQLAKGTTVSRILFNDIRQKLVSLLSRGSDGVTMVVMLKSLADPGAEELSKIDWENTEAMKKRFGPILMEMKLIDGTGQVLQEIREIIARTIRITPPAEDRKGYIVGLNDPELIEEPGQASDRAVLSGKEVADGFKQPGLIGDNDFIYRKVFAAAEGREIDDGGYYAALEIIQALKIFGPKFNKDQRLLFREKLKDVNWLMDNRAGAADLLKVFVENNDKVMGYPLWFVDLAEAALVEEEAPKFTPRADGKKTRIGVFTGGGPATGHNSYIATLARRAYAIGGDNIELVLLPGGWASLVNESYIKEARVVTIKDLVGRELTGGTIAETTRTNLFMENKKPLPIVNPKSTKAIQTLINLDLDGIVPLGGDDTLGAAGKMILAIEEYKKLPATSEEEKEYLDKLRMIGGPKTMDNDIEFNDPEADPTYGFESDVEATTEAIRNIKHTAIDGSRVMIAEVFGRNAGFVALQSGKNAGVARTLIVEEGNIDLEELIKNIGEFYSRYGWGVVVVAEGVKFNPEYKDNAKIFIRAFGNSEVAEAAFQHPNKETDEFNQEKLGGAGEILEALLKTGLSEYSYKDRKAKVTKIGKLDYPQREANIVEQDLIKTRVMGEATIDMILRGETGKLVYTANNISEIRTRALTPDIGGRKAKIGEGEADREDYEMANWALFPERMKDAAMLAMAKEALTTMTLEQLKLIAGGDEKTISDLKDALKASMAGVLLGSGLDSAARREGDLRNIVSEVINAARMIKEAYQILTGNSDLDIKFQNSSVNEFNESMARKALVGLIANPETKDKLTADIMQLILWLVNAAKGYMSTPVNIITTESILSGIDPAFSINKPWFDFTMARLDLARFEELVTLYNVQVKGLAYYSIYRDLYQALFVDSDIRKKVVEERMRKDVGQERNRGVRDDYAMLSVALARLYVQELQRIITFVEAKNKQNPELLIKEVGNETGVILWEDAEHPVGSVSMSDPVTEEETFKNKRRITADIAKSLARELFNNHFVMYVSAKYPDTAQTTAILVRLPSRPRNPKAQIDIVVRALESYKTRYLAYIEAEPAAADQMMAGNNEQVYDLFPAIVKDWIAYILSNDPGLSRPEVIEIFKSIAEKSKDLKEEGLNGVYSKLSAKEKPVVLYILIRYPSLRIVNVLSEIKKAIESSNRRNEPDKAMLSDKTYLAGKEVDRETLLKLLDDIENMLTKEEFSIIKKDTLVFDFSYRGLEGEKVYSLKDALEAVVYGLSRWDTGNGIQMETSVLTEVVTENYSFRIENRLSKKIDDFKGEVLKAVKFWKEMLRAETAYSKSELEIKREEIKRYRRNTDGIRALELDITHVLEMPFRFGYDRGRAARIARAIVDAYEFNQNENELLFDSLMPRNIVSRDSLLDELARKAGEDKEQMKYLLWAVNSYLNGSSDIFYPNLYEISRKHVEGNLKKAWAILREKGTSKIVINVDKYTQWMLGLYEDNSSLSLRYSEQNADNFLPLISSPLTEVFDGMVEKEKAAMLAAVDTYLKTGFWPDNLQEVISGDKAMLSSSDMAKIPEAARSNIEAGVIYGERYQSALKVLLEIGEEKLMAGWDDPGINDDRKQAFLEQILFLNAKYPGGLAAYKANAKRLLAASKGRKNPFDGYEAQVPQGQQLTVLDKRFRAIEREGLQAVNKTAFALVAGGMGERLGYKSGIKIEIPLDLATGKSYIQVFIENILALQKSSNEITGEERAIPLFIMTSEETHKLTVDFLTKNKFFGMNGLTVNPTQEQVQQGQTKQIIIMQQDAVATLADNDANFVLRPDDQYKLEAKPHNHGDILVLMRNVGIVDYWRTKGIKHTVFFQDTNGQVFNAVLAGLVSSLERGLEMNFITVSRDVGESAGAIMTMVNKQADKRWTGNVEYNQVALVLPGGDTADPNTGKSAFPGNLNVFILENNAFSEVLRLTGGIVGEFVNPKYTLDKAGAVGDRETLKSPARLESMMQDIAQVFPGDKVGFTNFDKRDVFSPVKNGYPEALKKVDNGNYPDAMATGEADYYKYGRKLMDLAGVQINVEGNTRFTQGIPYQEGAKIVFTRSFAPTVDDFISKIRGGKVSDRSVVIIDGEDIEISNADIDGTFIVRTVSGRSIKIEGVSIKNGGWEYVDLTPEEMSDVSVPEYLKMRGYKIVKTDQQVIDLSSFPEGKYVLDNNGLRKVIDEALLASAEVDSLEKEFDAIAAFVKPTPGAKLDFEAAEKLMAFSSKFNYYTASPEAMPKFDALLVKKSKFARDLAIEWIKNNPKNAPGYQEFIDQLLGQAFADIESFGKKKAGDMTAESLRKNIEWTKRLLPEWLSAKNNIPDFIKSGIIRGILEGRSEDILFCFGPGWRMFGTAGIRNPAVQSSFGVLADLELDEFAGKEPGFPGQQAPILTGPNLMNVITLLQQESAIVNVYRKLQEELAYGTADELIKQKKLDPRFVEDVKNNKVSIAYDSRLNGKYYAHMLAAAFLKDGVSVDLFDRPAGVPAVVYQASEDPNNRSAVAILISASHSPAHFNGFKAFISVQRAQVDKAGKNIIVDERGVIAGDFVNEVMPYRMPSEIGSMTMEEFDDIFARHSKGKKDEDSISWWIQRPSNSILFFREKFKLGEARLRWFGKEEFNPQTNRNGAYFDNQFYSRYYKHIMELSPVELLSLSEAERGKVEQARQELGIFYTAFGGVGAVNAQDFPGFLKHAGYTELSLNENQTLEFNGSFSGFNRPGGKFGMPDPGVTQGWIVNFIEFLQQTAGQNLDVNLPQAVSLMNSLNIGLATDPDIDRAGIDIPLTKGIIGGNIKEPLIKAVAEKLAAQGVDKSRIKIVTRYLEDNLIDHLLLTANDAWNFIVFHKLRMMHERGKLSKEKLYIIEKSHVTTDALVFIAEYFRKEYGYNIYTLDTYVGFTELAKKSRDLFKIARIAWFINRHLSAAQAQERNVALTQLLAELKGLNAELKSNVMYQRQGVLLIDEAIDKLEAFVAEGEGNKADIIKALSIIAHMEIPMGVEESNGYGEFGVFVPNEYLQINQNDTNWQRDEVGRIEKEHISEKDGSLAAFEFAELLSLGKALENKEPFEMYLDIFRAIGAVGTDNRFIDYQGLTGEEKKLNAVSWFEKTFGVILKRAIDKGAKVTLFNGKYEVVDVEIYRDAKFDSFWTGFPEEGVRLILKRVEDGVILFSTARPSGTGANNRSYNWVFGAKEYKGKPIAQMDYAELNAYRLEIVNGLNEMSLDFFGIQHVDRGYAQLSKSEFRGLMSALSELQREEYDTLLEKVIDQPDIAQGLSANEQRMKEITDNVSFVLANKYIDSKTGRYKHIQDDKDLQALTYSVRLAWQRFLTSEEMADEFKEDAWVYLYANGRLLFSVPRAYAMGWQTTLAHYIASLLSEIKGEKVTISSNDRELMDVVAKRYSNQPGLNIGEIVIGNYSESALLSASDELPAKLDQTKGASQGEDKAQLGDKASEVGGINLNPKIFDLQIKRDGKGVPLPINYQQIENINIQGFIPIIINITPINNLPLLLGVADTENNSVDLSKIKSVDYDRQKRFDMAKNN
ncbi:MAG: UTP--glucose-1-phosphate uridylyltransferase, partial [Candidatus Omnitrophica bacterium]|nr:UTP--glucose-1-phosphate uridylyltransferase [Candidatus Omnitrophota bacterium]